MILRTPRLLLRPLQASDQAALHELNSSAEVQRFLSQCSPTPQQTVDTVRRQLAVNRLHHGLGHFVAVPADDPGAPLLGWFHLRAEDGDIFNPSLGWRLAPSSWGRGLATEAADALLEHAFSQLQATSVWAETLPENRASQRVMDRLGMIRSDHDGLVRATITRDDWFDAHDDVRARLQELQATALRAKDGATLARLRDVGTLLASVEADGARASLALVAQLAAAHGFQLWGPRVSGASKGSLSSYPQP